MAIITLSISRRPDLPSLCSDNLRMDGGGLSDGMIDLYDLEE